MSTEVAMEGLRRLLAWAGAPGALDCAEPPAPAGAAREQCERLPAAYAESPRAARRHRAAADPIRRRRPARGGRRAADRPRIARGPARIRASDGSGAAADLATPPAARGPPAQAAASPAASGRSRRRRPQWQDPPGRRSRSTPLAKIRSGSDVPGSEARRSAPGRPIALD